MQQAPQVSIHLQALLQLLLVQSAAFPRRDFQAAFQRLQAACLCWSGVEDSPSNSKSKSSVLGSELAAQSCESLVRALRLLNDSDLVWESKTICVAKCFLALACALRAFKTARDVLVPGQLVTICGLQSSAGSALNGLRGEVRQFHAESGRFMVSLERGDPPAEWKKLRPQNLQPDIDQSSCASLAFKGAKECGRACLEAVAEIFDDLLVQLHEEDGDELRVRLLHAQLASAMWEALLSCTDDLQMEASALLDLCSDDCTLCSMLARHLFSVHLTVRPEELDPYRIKRLLTLQESFAKAYCRLYQPSALWGPTSETAGDIRDLQANLQAHILKLANAAVQMGVLQQLIDSCDFHIDRAIAGIGPGIYPVPLVLPVLLSRLVCTLAMNGDSFVRRHVLMLVPAFLSVAESFAELVIARLEAEAANSSELLKASQAVLDATLAAIGLGLQDESRARVEALAGQFLRSAARSDAALLSRLALTLLGASQSAEWIGQSFGQLSTLQQGIFWQQTRARSHLLLCSFEDVQIALKEWCGEPSPLPPFEQPLEVPDAADTEGNEAGDCGCEALELPQDALPPLEALPVMAAAQRKALKPLGRNDIERLRGVDPADAPEDLRCAIDGKLLGVPMLSPYGHVFEQDTLKQWLATCGSVCPITGRALREEDCQVDGATQAKVRDWVKAARMSYKLKKQEKRRLRAESQNDEPTEPD
ncbi:unnamed protein product [Durusdinium trenchii]|uniref:U-box domain-containing protein n=1 Tax=Durusdinium trenchii TaxID=1381693 RepID=A0ABP0HNX8_9DINO